MGGGRRAELERQDSVGGEWVWPYRGTHKGRHEESGEKLKVGDEKRDLIREDIVEFLGTCMGPRSSPVHGVRLESRGSRRSGFGFQSGTNESGSSRMDLGRLTCMYNVLPWRRKPRRHDDD